MTVGTVAAKNKSERDLRIDFFRGVALLIIFWDHAISITAVDGFVFRNSLMYWGYSDAAEIFVFLSGFVFGLVYVRVLTSRGFWLCQAKAFHRATQLYVANLFMLIIVLAIMGGAHLLFDLPAKHVEIVFEQPAQTLTRSVLLNYFPHGFNILPLYMAVLIVMPPLLMLSRKTLLGAIAISGTVYAVAQVWPALNLPIYASNLPGWPFNPFAWQFLFFLGMVIGAVRREGRNLVPYNKWLVLIASLFLLSAPVIRIGAMLGKRDMLFMGAFYDTLGSIYFPFVGMTKVNEAPIRLLHILSLAYVCAAILPKDLSFWRSRIAAPVIVAGQHSLEVFCVQVMLTYLTFCAMTLLGNHTPMLYPLVLAGWVVMILAAYAVRYRNRAPWQIPKSIPQPAPAGKVVEEILRERGALVDAGAQKRAE